MRVAVIGCGPAGLAAAHAAAGMECSVRIFSPKNKTPQLGPIMLHRPIPGINREHPDGYVRQLVMDGSILDYRLRTYGDVNIKINGDVLEPGFHTWPVPVAYDRMWDLYEKMIEDRTLYPGDIATITAEYDLVINTAPLNKLCLQTPGSGGVPHVFNSFPVALKFQYSYPDQPPNTVIYNGGDRVPWVRSSRIFEDEVTEYKVGDCPDPDLIIRKPLNTTCNCHPRVLRTGRFGTWHNETWIDHAYYDTRTALVSMQHQTEWDSVK